LETRYFGTRQFKNARTLRILTAEIRIMAAMSQLPRRESNKQHEMILCQINEMASAAGIS
jgi:hypothetical protein